MQEFLDSNFERQHRQNDLLIYLEYLVIIFGHNFLVQALTLSSRSCWRTSLVESSLRRTSCVDLPAGRTWWWRSNHESVLPVPTGTVRSMSACPSHSSNSTRNCGYVLYALRQWGIRTVIDYFKYSPAYNSVQGQHNYGYRKVLPFQLSEINYLIQLKRPKTLG